jgi:hypothetical protein
MSPLCWESHVASTTLQHDQASQFAGLQAANTRSQNQRSHPEFTPDDALKYDANTLSENGTKLAAVQRILDQVVY